MADRPIKICFIAPKAYPLFNPQVTSVFGGSEVDLYLLATELAKDENFKVSCIVADYAQPKIETIENVRLIKSINFNQNQFAGMVKIWKAMKTADADVYMIKTASPGVPLAAAFCQLHNRKFIYRIAHRYECDGTYMKDHLLLGKAFAASLRRCDTIFAQNVYDQDALKQTIGVDSTVIPNGHRIPALESIEKDTILWVGRSTDFKKPVRFLELAKSFPDEKFVMICQRATDDSCYDQLIRSAEGISNLKFHSSVPFHQIDSFFQRAKVLVNTSDAEGFPNTFIQAGKAATAILSLTVNPDNFLDEYNCGLACNADQNKMNQNLKEMLKEDRFSDLGNDAKTYIQKKHDIEIIIQQYKNILLELKGQAR